MIRIYHTIHHQSTRQPFAVHMDGRTFMMCFQNKKSAVHTARLMEAHKDMTGAWPNTEVTADSPMDIDAPKNLVVHRPLDELYCQEWTDTELQKYAVENLLHMLLIEGTGNRLSTRMVMFKYTPNFVRHRLQSHMF